MSDFYQSPPALGNQYTEDRALRAVLGRLLPGALLAAAEPGLATLGERAVGDILEAGDRAESEPPRHVPYDAWGRRVDRIEVSDGWRRLERIAAEEGIVAAAYERALGAHSRIEQLARLYLYHPSSAIFSCPLAMTDGAARCLELLAGDDERLRAAFRRLTSRDPGEMWTSGQWMTERTGGSDVSCTSTIAWREGDGWRLHGTKWFTSATTSQMALTLARIEGAPPGNEGLSLFYLELRDADGALRGIRVHRLKEKLGTRALPTAELTLEGTPAILIGEPGQGVRRIATLLNITRVYNACCAAAGMRRAVALAASYARERRAFGRALIEHPLHRETLAEMEMGTRAALQLVFEVARLLGREECGEATDDERAILRLLTPVAKLYTGKQAVAVASEALEAFGGAGYVEDTGLPRLLRDAQVLPIWEGTTNVLSLDVLRAIARADALAPWMADVRRRLGALTVPELATPAERVRAALERIAMRVADAARDGDASQAGARGLAYAIARAAAGALLLEQAEWDARVRGDATGTIVARRWCAGDLAPLVRADAEWRADTAALA
ncbi:MAG TPA: acyl-CoA dehydrogenase family protein [Gemmatimonadaceae bacterium]|nr:acyl-CoA dehydrogenase family protein [Gemmatimonadaceae bacterium]